MTQTEAFTALSPAAVQKLKDARIDINALLSNNSNDLIVNLKQTGYPLDTSSNTGAVAVRKYRAVKDTLSAQLSKNSTLMRDYYGSPVQFYRIAGKEDLVALLNSKEVESVVANAKLTTTANNLDLIKQPETAAIRFRFRNDPNTTHSFQGQGATVAVIDTGLDSTHADFGCRAEATCKVIDVLEFATENNGRADGRLEDSDSRHGTNVASIISQVAPQSKLVGLDVFYWTWDSTKRKWVHVAPNSAINAALNWVYNNHQSNNIDGFNFTSLNMSLGGGYEQRETNQLPILKSLKDVGVASVVASGNDFYTDAIAWPASERHAISVGAVHDTANSRVSERCPVAVRRGQRVDDVTCFSNSGSLLDMLAPGYNVAGGGVTLSGTSMAAPHVAGAYAVLRAPASLRITGDSVDRSTQRLKDTGALVTDSRNALVRPRIDLQAAARSQFNQ